MHNEKLLLNIQETADVLRVHRSTVSRMLDAGELPCVLVRSRKLVRFSDLLEFIDSQIRESEDGNSRED